MIKIDDLPLKVGIYNLLLRNLLQTFGQYDFSIIFMILHNSADFLNIIVYFRQIFAHYLYSRGNIIIIHNLKNKYICQVSPPSLTIFALFVQSRISIHTLMIFTTIIGPSCGPQEAK